MTNPNVDRQQQEAQLSGQTVQYRRHFSIKHNLDYYENLDGEDDVGSATRGQHERECESVDSKAQNARIFGSNRIIFVSPSSKALKCLCIFGSGEKHFLLVLSHC